MLKQNNITSLANFVKSEIESADVEKWDLFLVDKQVFGAYFYHSRFDQTLHRELNTHTRNLNYYIRIFKDKGSENMGIGFVELNTPSSNLIQKAIHRAKSIANVTSERKYDLIHPGKAYQNPQTIDQNTWEDPHGFLQRKAKYLQQRLQENIGVTTTFGKFRTYKVQKMLVNSNGFNKTKKSTDYCYEFSFKAENNGKKAEYWPLSFLKTADQLQFNDYISEWVSRTRDLLNAKKTPNFSSVDVILPANIIRSIFLSTISFATKAKALYEKTTPFEKGMKVASERFTLIDDGLIAGGLNTSGWDSEGFPKKRTPVIKNGVMNEFLFDQRFATLLNEKSTGNAQRNPNEGGIMNIDYNNMIIMPGTRPLKKILADCSGGLFLSDLNWVNSNPLSGQFTAEVALGYEIKDGTLGRPIKGGYFTGNVYQMIHEIDAISSETRVVMNTQIPYIKFKNLRIVN